MSAKTKTTFSLLTLGLVPLFILGSLLYSEISSSATRGYLIFLLILISIVVALVVLLVDRFLTGPDIGKTALASIASHQLRTPVSGLNWLIEALQRSQDNFNEKQKQYLSDLSTLTKRLLDIIEDLLDPNRTELKTAISRKEKINLVEFLEEFTKEIKNYADYKKHGIVLHQNNETGLVVELDKRALYNILQNLVSNAVDYSAPHTDVTIDIAQDENFAKILISNKGPTIAKNEQPRMFEKFYRGETAKQLKTKGTGLGLYIVKLLAEEAGGKAGFESEVGKDTVFWFTLPIAKR